MTGDYTPGSMDHELKLKIKLTDNTDPSHQFSSYGVDASETDYGPAGQVDVQH